VRAMSSRPLLDRSRAFGDRAGRTEDGGSEHFGQDLRIQVERVQVLPPQQVDQARRPGRCQDGFGTGGFWTGLGTAAYAYAECSEVVSECGSGAPLGVEDEPSRAAVRVEGERGRQRDELERDRLPAGRPAFARERVRDADHRSAHPAEAAAAPLAPESWQP